MKIEGLTKINISQGFQKKEFTWSSFCFMIGSKNPVLKDIKEGLEKEGEFDMAGVMVTTDFSKSKHHIN